MRFALTCVFRREGRLGLLVNLRAKRVFRLNPVATDVAEALSISPLSVDDITSVLLQFYDQSEKILRRDVRRFLAYHELSGNVSKTLKHGTTPPRTDRIGRTIRKSHKRVVLDYPSAPFSVSIYPTFQCNQRCLFCYAARESGCTAGSESAKLRKDELLSLVDEVVEWGVVRLNIVGGEPTLDLDLLYSLLERSTPNMTAGFATNGSYRGGISTEEASRLAKFPNLDVVVSLEAVTPSLHDRIVGLEGAFQSASRTLRNLVKAGVRTSVQTVATKYNVHEILDLARAARRIGAHGFGLLDLLPGGRALASDYWELAVAPPHMLAVVQKLHLMRKMYAPSFDVDYTYYFPFMFDLKIHKSILESQWNRICGVGIYDIEIDPNGDAYPCAITIGSENFKLGNVRVCSLREIWASPRLAFFRERDAEMFTNETCRICTYKDVCVTGCLLSSEFLSGKAYAGDPRCPILYDRSLTEMKKSV